MQGRTISADVVIAATLWAFMAALFIAAWVLYFTGYNWTAIMLALSGCPVAAAAMIGQIRCYTSRVCGLVSATRFQGADAPVHSLR